MKHIYFFPSAPKGGYVNPYIINFKKSMAKYFKVLEADNHSSIMLSLNLFFHSFKADIFIINWLESICFLRLGFLQYLLARLSLIIIRTRDKQIIWILHNVHPHQGNNKLSKKMQETLFKQSNLIISHSYEAYLFAKGKTETKVIYICHPVKKIAIGTKSHKVNKFDILIWGSIFPYKGVYEFISLKEVQDSDLRIIIIGKCADNELAEKIYHCCSEHIYFDNRRAEFDELMPYIRASKYVLFPYIGKSISSSGALIDTIVLGGNPVGPNLGAFRDLSKEGVCFVYENYEKLIELLNSKKEISNGERTFFIESNSWESFAKKINKLLST